MQRVKAAQKCVWCATCPMIIPSTLHDGAQEGERNVIKWFHLHAIWDLWGKRQFTISSSLDLGGDGEVKQTSIYNITEKGQEENPSVTLRPYDLSRLLGGCCPQKVTHRVKTYFQGFCRSLCYGSVEESDTLSEPLQPFSVDEMFHASLSTDCKIRVTLCPLALWETIVALWAKLS